MKTIYYLLSLAIAMLICQQLSAQCLADPESYGFASLNGGTNGGQGGEVVVVQTLEEFNQHIQRPERLIIYVKGTLTGNVIIASQNKTVHGFKGAKIQGYLGVFPGAKNVIIRNLIVRGDLPCPGDCQDGLDAVSITGAGGPDVPAEYSSLPAPTNIWLDHMDIADGQDGNCDLKRGVDNVTISWTKFSYTNSKEHAFSNLIGHDDANSSQDDGKLNTTFYQCWWADNIQERQPRVRFGKVHVLNSLYTSSGSSVVYGLGVKANVLSENNVVKAGGTFAGDYGDYTAFESRNNSGKSNSQLGGTVFTPPYTIAPASTSSLEAGIRSCAGATLSDPVITGLDEEVNNTEKLMVIPNPFQNTLTINIPEDASYDLINQQGQVLNSGKGSIQLNTVNLLPGLYFLKVGNKHKTDTIKLQKPN